MIKLILKITLFITIIHAFTLAISRCLLFILSREKKEKTDYILPIIVIIFSIGSIYSILGEIPKCYEKYQRQGSEYRIFN